MFVKKIILIILLSAVIPNLTAQYRFGLSGGSMISSLTGNDFTATDLPKIGVTFGFFYEYEFKRNFSLLFEPMFAQKGAKYTFYPRFDTQVDVDNRLNYFTIPVLAKINFPGKIDYYLTTGLSLSYLADYKSNIHAYVGSYELPFEPFFPYSYNKMDAGASFGFGIMWKEIFLDFRYIHGLRNIYDSKEDIPSIRNQVLSVKLAFSLYRKKYLPCYKKL
ncbi:MAG: PorT family protein [Bacteroidales bacterium]|nr:PorT family protein [Bacteroidales bacterium]